MAGLSGGGGLRNRTFIVIAKKILDKGGWLKIPILPDFLNGWSFLDYHKNQIYTIASLSCSQTADINVKYELNRNKFKWREKKRGKKRHRETQRDRETD